MMQNQVATKASVAAPVPSDTTKLTAAEAITCKIRHQTQAGNELTWIECVYIWKAKQVYRISA